MTGDRDLAMLIGNGLSIAFSDELLLGSISKEMTARFTAAYTGGDAVARAMQKVAQHQPTGDPVADFEVMIGAFGGQSDILEDLAVFADLTKNSDKDIANAIQKVRDFVSEVQRRGIGHTLQIISERSYSDTSRRQLTSFFESILSAFRESVTVANLNYDTLVLSVLAETYWSDLTDMANGRYDAGTIKVGGIPYKSWPLRTTASEFLPFGQRRIRLLHLHGSLTYWRFGPGDYRKLPIEAVRSQIWEIFRNENTFTGRPLVVLANQHEKTNYVTKYPYDLAYDVAESGFKEANNWLIVGYSFRDMCVNDMLIRCWEARADPPQILVVTYGDGLEVETIEDAFGWEHGTAATHNLAIERSGAFGLAASSGWSEFTAGL
jgi:hypothetical protein